MRIRNVKYMLMPHVTDVNYLTDQTSSLHAELTANKKYHHQHDSILKRAA